MHWCPTSAPQWQKKPTQKKQSSHLVIIPIRARRKEAVASRRRRTQRSLVEEVPAKCCAAPSLHPPLHPSLHPSLHFDAFSRSHAEENPRLAGETAPTWVFGGFRFIHPSSLPPSSSSSSSSSLLLLPHPSLPRLPSSISLNFELDVSEMLISSAWGREDKGDKSRLFGF